MQFEKSVDLKFCLKSVFKNSFDKTIFKYYSLIFYRIKVILELKIF